MNLEPVVIQVRVDSPVRIQALVVIQDYRASPDSPELIQALAVIQDYLDFLEK